MQPILPESRIRAASTRRLDEDILAADVLSFLAAEPDRLASFLGSTGIAPGTIRQSATEPSFIDGLLDYVMSDETLLVEFASHLGRTPEVISASIHRRRGPIEAA